MAEKSISNRLLFRPGQQQRFLERAEKALDMPPREIARLLNISRRTFADWKRERYSLSLKAAKVLQRRTKIDIPKNVIVREPFWYTSIGARKGGRAVYKKYGHIGGDPERRTERWREWWETKGKYTTRLPFRPIPIKKPRPSSDLAEFVGIMMGDGGMSERQLFITLHCRDDREYTKYVADLIEKLFDTQPRIYVREKDSVNNIVVSRIQLVQFCRDRLGLNVGDKIRQGLDVPQWIWQKRKYQIACLRGLVDTDGCVFTHAYHVNGKLYQYKKLVFTSGSPLLIRSVQRTFQILGFSPQVARGREVRLNSGKDMKRYFQFIGTHNPKHLRRFKK